MSGTEQKLGEISGKLDMVISNQEADRARNSALEQRVRGLESRQYVTTGASGMLGAVVGVLFGHTFKWPF